MTDQSAPRELTEAERQRCIEIIEAENCMFAPIARRAMREGIAIGRAEAFDAPRRAAMEAALREACDDLASLTGIGGDLEDDEKRVAAYRATLPILPDVSVRPGATTDQSASRELLPCPFCGGAAVYDSRVEVVNCVDCGGACAPVVDQSAENGWNRRSVVDVPRADRSTDRFDLAQSRKSILSAMHKEVVDKMQGVTDFGEAVELATIAKYLAAQADGGTTT